MFLGTSGGRAVSPAKQTALHRLGLVSSYSAEPTTARRTGCSAPYSRTGTARRTSRSTALFAEGSRGTACIGGGAAEPATCSLRREQLIGLRPPFPSQSISASARSFAIAWSPLARASVSSFQAAAGSISISPCGSIDASTPARFCMRGSSALVRLLVSAAHPRSVRFRSACPCSSRSVRGRSQQR